MNIHFKQVNFEVNNFTLIINYKLRKLETIANYYIYSTFNIVRFHSDPFMHQSCVNNHDLQLH